MVKTLETSPTARSEVFSEFGITDACVAAFALIWFSITISFKGANMPDGWDG